MRSVYDIVYDTANRHHCTVDMHIPQAGHDTALIYLHGGGLTGGGKSDFDMHIRPLTSRSIAVYSANYRLYPDCAFPDFIEDAARAIAKILARHPSAKFCVAGSSAGAYIAMMLCFDGRYLARHGIGPGRIAGWLFDAGQPTAHFRVLEERGLDGRLIRVDETAPMYFVTPERARLAAGERYLFLCARDDMPGRLEQNLLMVKAMETCGFDPASLELRVIENSGHCQYDFDDRFTGILLEFLQSL